MPVGVDIVEPPMLAALEAEGIAVHDAQQTMLDAREVKSVDEITLDVMSLRIDRSLVAAMAYEPA